MIKAAQPDKSNKVKKVESRIRVPVVISYGLIIIGLPGGVKSRRELFFKNKGKPVTPAG